MYLKRLELQGFKTFAQRTVLEFVPDTAERQGVTAIVGPNGSGKSNIADAIRWVMGEQSLKLLRGKKSEDVIFSGTENRPRSGFAEVHLFLENTDHAEIPQQEIQITRRLYRDGQSEYEVNKQAARLQDVALLLAQCGIAQRAYSVIAQGMVDQVLVASPSERKDFFDEAFGLRPFQLKRHQAVHKLDEARKNLTQTELLLREIEPRLSSLERQAKRLQERGRIEEELRNLERAYYGQSWRELQRGWEVAKGRAERAEHEERQKEEEAKKLEQELGSLEKVIPQREGFRELRLGLDRLLEERARLREQRLKLETKREIAAVRAEKPWAPLPLSKIIESVDRLQQGHEMLDRLLHYAEPDLHAVRQIAERLRSAGVELLGKLQRPAPEPAQEVVRDPDLEREMSHITEALAEVERRIKEAEARVEAWSAEQEGSRKHVFELQHRLNQRRQEQREAERRAAEAAVELARFETRREAVLNEIRQHAAHLEDDLDVLVQQAATNVSADAGARLQRLRSQLEWIGGIDPAVVKEYEETKTRHVFLSEQTQDLRQSITDLDLVIEELDQTIRTRSESAFRELDREFGLYFKKLFQGGEAKLVETQPEPELDEQGMEIPPSDPNKVISGIDIQVTPPGKRFKSISLLSGGERALTSIALICAIMATHPSPFVVLDEVDAALDESNSRKFAEIILSLASKTQFIVVTHNRATMQQANVLYGVTMREDGSSQLLSVKLEDIEKLRGKSVQRI